MSATSHEREGRGISVRLLLLVVGLTAMVSGAAGWMLRREPNVAALVAHDPASELPDGVVELSETAQRNTGLQIVHAVTDRLPATIEVTGSVAPDDARVAHIRPLARGLVERVWVRPGERVRRGQPLVTYDNIQLGELVGEYLGARAVLQQAAADQLVKQRMVERARALIAIEAIARQTLDLREAELKAADAAMARERAAVARVEEQLHRFGLSDDDLERLSPTDGNSPHREASHAVLRAPFDGVVTKYDVAQGELVEPERELLTVTDLSTVWVLGAVYEQDLAKVGAGGDVTVRVDAFPGRAFAGRITHVADRLDPQTRSASVRCVVDNADMSLKIDMFARVTMPTAGRREAVILPAAAVQQIDGQSVIFVRDTPTRFVRRFVELGATAGGLVEARDGVRAGEALVGEGSFYLKTALLRERIGDEH